MEICICFLHNGPNTYFCKCAGLFPFQKPGICICNFKLLPGDLQSVSASIVHYSRIKLVCNNLDRDGIPVADFMCWVFKAYGCLTPPNALAKPRGTRGPKTNIFLSQICLDIIRGKQLYGAKFYTPTSRPTPENALLGMLGLLKEGKV